MLGLFRNNSKKRQVFFWWWTDLVNLNNGDSDKDMTSETDASCVVGNMRRAILQLKGKYMNEKGYAMAKDFTMMRAMHTVIMP